MTTIADAMADATEELRATRLAVDALRAEVEAELAAKTTAAQTVINNFLNRAPVQEYFVHSAAGTDAAGYGSAIDKPAASTDYILDIRDQSVVSLIGLLSDDTLKRSHPAFSTVAIRGISATPGPFGGAYSFTRRKLSFLGEATNSPAAGVGRFVPGITQYAGTLQFLNIDLALPTPPGGMQQYVHLNMAGGAFSFDTGTITADSAGSLAVLLQALSSQRTGISFTNMVMGVNAAGKLLLGVGAGVDPRPAFQYDTNLTSA